MITGLSRNCMTNAIYSRGLRSIFALVVMIALVTIASSQDIASGPQENEWSLDVSKSELTTAVMLTPVLTITPITWGVVGLDSNNVNDGPNLFPVGARVCNTGTTAATNVVSSFVWTSANVNINLRTGSVSSLTLPTLNAGSCTDSYFEIQINRIAAAYNTTRGFRIDATADGLGTVSTPANRELYVEKLVSQNRNSVTGIRLNGVAVPFGGTMNLTVGNTYTIRLDASTATNGYEQIESFINLPNVIFQTISVASTYTAPTGYTGNKLYEDACGWDPVVGSVDYRSCIGPVNVPGGKAGGTVSITYTVKILSGAGTSSTLNTLIYDFSGSSYHYNNDFSTTFVTAQIVPPASAAGVSVSGRMANADGYGIRNAIVYLMEEDGTVHQTRTGSFGYYQFDDIPAGQSVVVTVASKRYTFVPSSQVVSLTDSIADLDWTSID